METESVPLEEKAVEPVATQSTQSAPSAVSESLFSLPQAVIDDETARAAIYARESSGRLDAVNSGSGACGLGQALPCSKMSDVCPDWKTELACQDKWFTDYAVKRYGSWFSAYNFWAVNRWW